jgi:hypothetical protein
MNRRTMLKITAPFAGLCAAHPEAVLGQADGMANWRAGVLKFLAGLARPGGGYSWDDQSEPHLTPTFAVIGCHRLLGQEPPNRKGLTDFVRTHHPAQLKKLEQEHREFEFQQIQALLWLGEDATTFRTQVAGWTAPVRYMAQYERSACPVLRFQLTAFTCRKLLGLPVDDLSRDFIPYLEARRRPNGSFNNTPASDGGDGHVMNTLWGLEALDVIGRIGEKKEEVIAWLRACQLPTGGFTWQPRPEFAGVEDVAYTRCAVRALGLLGARPAQPDACIRYLHSLWNADGGAGDRPGWQSNPAATYHALDALAGLDALRAPPKRPDTLAKRSPTLPSNLRVFSIQIEAHGQGSPYEAVDLAKALRIHLWGAKNSKPEWMTTAQGIASRLKAPVMFFTADEEHGTWVNVPGMGTYSHTADIIAPPGSNFGSSLTGAATVSWPEFRSRRLKPLAAAGGHLVWQFGENEELVRLYLDDSIERGGYAAISTFHFGNPDFTNSEPFLNRYRHHIPFVALQDAHGIEPWWFADMTTGFRTLFLSTEPTWEGWLNALRQNWVVAVRHDAVSANKTWMHGGAHEVLEFVRQREQDWRWWDNPSIQRPMVSVVAVRPGDTFEAGRPDAGILIRVRCAWENTTQGLAKRPISELIQLTVDGKLVEPKLFQKKQAAALADSHHFVHLPSPSPGLHRAVARVRVIETGKEVERSIEFDA